MVVVSVTGSTDSTNYDREAEIKAFDDTKAGVKGLVDSGVTKIPRIFYSKEFNETSAMVATDSTLSVPVIDLSDIHNNADLHALVVDKIRSACSEWGAFQVTNHGIPISVLNEMIDGIRRFHEQDAEVRKQFYTRDLKKKVMYYSSPTIYQDKFADWRDSVGCFMAPHPPTPEEIPAVFRDIMIEYSKRIRALGCIIFELLSEALGLNPSFLKELNCDEGLYVLTQYYPPCPEPELTMGSTKHTDSAVLTILLQDQLGGLQVLHKNQWFNVSPLHGALIVNMGDLLQLITNGKFISVYHRVLSSHKGPRISVASFFMNSRDPNDESASKVYGPIKELLLEGNPPIYRDTNLKDFLEHRHVKGHNFDANDCLQAFRLRSE